METFPSTDYYQDSFSQVSPSVDGLTYLNTSGTDVGKNLMSANDSDANPNFRSSQEMTVVIGTLLYATATLVSPDARETTSMIGQREPGENVLPWETPSNSTNFEMFLLLEKITACGISPILFIIGVSTNILNCIVFYRQGLRERMNLCLFALSVVDLGFVAVSSVMKAQCLIGQFSAGWGMWWYYFTFSYFTGPYAGFLLSSGCVTMIVAVERCLCIAMPLKASTLIKTQTLAVLIVTTLVVIIGGCCLLSFSTTVAERIHPVTGETFYYLAYTQFYLDNKVVVKALVDVVLRIAVPCTSFVVVTAATAITVIQLQRAITWRETSGSGSDDNNKRQKSLAKMLVIVSFVYIITACPGVVLGLVSVSMHNIIPSGASGNAYTTSFLIYEFLASLNSSVNFFIYVTRSARFRNTLRRLCFLTKAKQAGTLARSTYFSEVTASMESTAK